MKPDRRWRRVPTPAVLLLGSPGARAYQADLPDGHLSVIVARERDDSGDIVWHLSISHRTNEAAPQPGRYPSWDEIHEARYTFVPDELTMAILLPPKAEYVNVHSTTFHLWQVPS